LKKAYGPEGEWARLFRRDKRYLGTRLLSEVGAEPVYVTMDCWESREAYEEFQERWVAEYAAVDKKCQELTAKERKIGEF